MRGARIVEDQRTESAREGRRRASAWVPAFPPEVVERALTELSELGGYLASAVVDSGSGITIALDREDETFDVEIAAAANTVVMQAKLRAVEALGLQDDIADILITLGKHYHLICPVPENPRVFVYVALNRADANLELARIRTREASLLLEPLPIGEDGKTTVGED